MHVDYIVVGLGLAGLAFCRELEKQSKSFVVFDNSSQNASIVAGGMYNPVILKRFSKVWDAEEQLDLALPFYDSLESDFGKKYRYNLSIYRLFKSFEEQNNWISTSDRPFFNRFIEPQIHNEKIKGVTSDFGYGKMMNTGRIDTVQLLNDYREYLIKQNRLIVESFEHEIIQTSNTKVSYRNYTANKIVFCEGFGLKKNPFFNQLPLNGTKGELLEIFAPNLQIDFMLKAAVFVLPMGSKKFKVGATFNWEDKSASPTKEGKNELEKKLKSFLKTGYTITNHLAGIRPTVKDRRPLVGSHAVYKSMGVLNGLGTRGVMIAPKAARMLFEHMETGKSLPDDYSIKRFLQSE